ncbi:hypothetical protein T02_16127 [Trichinella nativa]|uniref:Uncharacterized protein n=1 Tax=Trichinella nativa TaxID=6335 RepID=A0A0V1KL22_9BILA|nr:hypothetical protein T02_16127 [Trichinella nativa]
MEANNDLIQFVTTKRHQQKLHFIIHAIVATSINKAAVLSVNLYPQTIIFRNYKKAPTEISIENSTH